MIFLRWLRYHATYQRSVLYSRARLRERVASTSDEGPHVRDRREGQAVGPYELGQVSRQLRHKPYTGLDRVKVAIDGGRLRQGARSADRELSQRS
jgi:hypothetical protein